ncbi:hypothetical protein GPY95_08765 [Campylobacter jejuni]|nr:hypothetical protein [Campylobacter jejuni]
MSNNKNILQHIDDLVNGIFDSTVMTALEFGHFVIKIIGVENIILDDNTKQDEAIEQAEVFYKAIKLIISNDQIRKQTFQFLKQDFQKQPLLYWEYSWTRCCGFFNQKTNAKNSLFQCK